MKIDLAQLNIKNAHEFLQHREISSRELLEFYGRNIKKREKDVHALLEVFDDAYEQAEEIDKWIKSGREVPLLAGIPMAIKDSILIKDKRCSAASKILENFTAPYDATVIKKLKEQGIVFTGRTNMDEFAMGSSTENSAFGSTKNPYDLKRVPGGSSGGSAVSVASQFCLAALGSDTAGSIRQPASFCRVVGLKPTYGSVSRNGLIAMASSFDQIGPLAKSVEDAEIIFNAIKGEDRMDSTTARNVGNPISNSNFAIGVPKEFFSLDRENERIEPKVAAEFKKALDTLRGLGFKVRQISIPSLDYALAVYYVIMPAEVSSNLARYDGIKYGFSKKAENLAETYKRIRRAGFGKEPRRRILLGTYVLSAGYYDEYYGRAQKMRSLMKDDFRKAFKEADILLCPTSPTLPFKIGERIDDPVKMYLADIFTVPANLVGVPAISIPCGPVGVQFFAPWFEEEKLFYLGKLFENAGS